MSQPHTSQRLVGSVDIYPTILDAAGSKVGDDLHGRSLRSVLQETNTVDWRKTLVAEFHFHGDTPFFPRRAITDGRFKLIHNLRTAETSASPSVDGDQAHIYAQQLASDDPARIAMQRLANPPEWELYDLQSDPIEFIDLSTEPSMAQTQQRLQKALLYWQERTGDPFADAAFADAVQQKHKSQ